MSEYLSEKLSLHAYPELMFASLREALLAGESGDHPVGAVIGLGNTIISSSGNRTHLDGDPTQHAEMAVIRATAQRLGRRNLNDCVLYSTYELCSMCATASVYARIGGIVVGSTVQDLRRHKEIYDPSPKWRNMGVSMDTILEAADYPIPVIKGYMRETCRVLFFMPEVNSFKT